MAVRDARRPETLVRQEAPLCAGEPGRPRGNPLPPGTRLSIGGAIIEVTPEPHTGCRKFVERFGIDALHLVNSPGGRSLNLRGINSRVIQAGVIRTSDPIRNQ